MTFVYVAGAVFLVAFAVGLAWDARRIARRRAERDLERVKRTREQRIRRLEIELGFADLADARVLSDGQIVSVREWETRSPHRVYQLSDREVAQLLLRHKGPHA